MSSLIVDFIISLDGYGAAEGWPGYWGMEGPEYFAWIKKHEEDEHTTLMGATTYRLMSGFAEEMPDDPGIAALTASPKVVFSSTLEAPLSWANTELVDGDPVEAVREMKRRDSRSLRTVGSLSLCRALLEAGLVDRFRVVVFPVISCLPYDAAGPGQARHLRRERLVQPSPDRAQPARAGRAVYSGPFVHPAQDRHDRDRAGRLHRDLCRVTAPGGRPPPRARGHRAGSPCLEGDLPPHAP